MTTTTPVNTSLETTSTTRRMLADLSRQELAQWCADQGESAYRADQIRRWLFGKRVNDFESMHDLPARLRAQLSEQFELFAAVVVEHQVAEDRTEKLLLRHADGEHTECVLMRETKRRTVCVSTQVGCAMGCVFCASGLFGLKRNLSTGEILEQILRLDRLLAEEERITNVVVMGIGEPLANLNSLLPALNTLNEKEAWDWERGGSRFPPWGCPRKSANWRPSAKRIIWPFHCMLPTMNCETNWSR